MKLNMYEDAHIKAHVQYSTFKKTIKVFLTSTNTLDELKAQLNKYFVYLGENHFTCHVFVQMLCVNLGANKDEDM